MKNKMLWVVLTCTMLGLAACEYDDSDLKESIQSLEKRVEAMEGIVNQLNGDIQTLQTVVTALKNQVSVVRVETVDTGYVLHFSDGTKAMIRDGKDGTDGTNGQDAPIVGIALDGGVYYWTLTTKGTTEWLKDDRGNRLPVSPEAGTPGTPGADGTTPQLSVDAQGYWLVSYDGGKHFERVLDANGQPVSALGEKGEPGAPGSAGDAFFQDVVNGKDAVILKMTDGTMITLPKKQSFSIAFWKTDEKPLASVKDIPMVENGSLILNYKVTGADEDTFVEIFASGNISVSQEGIAGRDAELKGKFTVTIKGKPNAQSKVLVLLCNSEKTITTVLTFVEKDDEVTNPGTEGWNEQQGQWDE